MMSVFDGVRREEPVALDRFQIVLNKWGREFMETRSEGYQKKHKGHRLDRDADMKLDGDQGWGGTDVTPGESESFWLEGKCDCGERYRHYFNTSPKMYDSLDQIWVIRELVNTDIWGVSDDKATKSEEA